MREWMRERMRRRSKRGPNDSEATGKIGQEIPADQPAPLRPSYETSPPASPTQHEPEAASESPQAVDEEQPIPEFSPVPEETTPVIATPEESGKLIVETQPESPSIPPPEPQSAGQPRGPKGFVVLTIGLPGSGKTTWFKRRGVSPLSSDMLRSILFDDITEQRYQGLVFSTLRSLLRARLIAKMPWNYVDATNLSPHERRQWIKMAKSFGYDVQAVFFDVPLEICMERNSRRERVVSDDVMKKLAERLRPPSFKEGFSKIIVVRVKNPGTPDAALPTAEE
jgi:predicted kinase